MNAPSQESVTLGAIRALPRPAAILFDLFHTLACVPAPAAVGETPISEILGVPGREWNRLYYEEDILGRALGHIKDDIGAIRIIARQLNAHVTEEQIRAAATSRRRRFELGLTRIEATMLDALDRLRSAGVQIALVSDAGSDDLFGWEVSPLRQRFETALFSYQLGIRKPDPRIYQHALEAIGVSAGDAFFVGDGGSDEHRGARAAGMQAVLVTRMLGVYYPERIPERRVHADWEFEDVPALVDALGL